MAASGSAPDHPTGRESRQRSPPGAGGLSVTGMVMLAPGLVIRTVTWEATVILSPSRTGRLVVTAATDVALIVWLEFHPFS